MLPTMRCERRVLADVSADPAGEPWTRLPSHPLSEAVGGQAPGQATAVKTAWNGAAWRVLFEVADTHISATLTERGAPLYQEEVVEIFVDPVGDLENYFEIEVNPLNAVLEV